MRVYSSKSAQCDLCLIPKYMFISLKKNNLRHIALYYYRKMPLIDLQNLKFILSSKDHKHQLRHIALILCVI